jgi:hypothetical protein
MVRFDGGALAEEPGVRLDGRTLIVERDRYTELDGFRAPVHVYRRVMPPTIAQMP